MGDGVLEHPKSPQDSETRHPIFEAGSISICPFGESEGGDKKIFHSISAHHIPCQNGAGRRTGERDEGNRHGGKFVFSFFSRE